MEHAMIKREDIFMAMKGGKSYTVADIEALPEGERAELIDGQIFMMAAPTLTHQELLVRISAAIWNYISEHKGGCRVLPAPFAVYIRNDDYNYVEPDISVICDEKKLDEKGCHGAPDWVIEIVSPTSRRTDCVRKLALYQAAGVREYWIVDPHQKTVTVYDFEHGEEPVQYPFPARIRAGLYEDLYIEFSDKS